MEKEQNIWEGTPSHWSNIMFYLGCSLLIFAYGFGLLLALWKYLDTRCNRIQITGERIIERRGILSITTNQLELYRVKDIKFEQPLLLRLFGLSQIVLITSDATNPEYVLRGLENGAILIGKLRNVIEKRRDMKGVRELDFN